MDGIPYDYAGFYHICVLKIDYLIHTDGSFELLVEECLVEIYRGRHACGWGSLCIFSGTMLCSVVKVYMLFA